MNDPLKVLIVEDSEDDSLLLLRELRRGGYGVQSERVETAEQMQAALDRHPWDVVLADYTLPTFSAPDALRLLQHHEQRDANDQSGRPWRNAPWSTIPFIIISGTVGEEVAVAAMKAGAHDYLTKGNLARLVPAVERELREAQERRKRNRAEQALRAADEALRRSQQQYQRLAEAAPVGIFRTDAAGNCIYVNEYWCQITGLSSEQSLGQHWAQVVHGDDRDRVFSQWQQIVGQGPQPEPLEFRFERPDGRVLWVWGQALVEQWQEGQVASYIGSVTDITEKKRLEAQVLRVQRLESLGTLASGIAHDFNNVLTPILAASQLLPLCLPTRDERSQSLLTMIGNSAKRGADLVKQILAFAQGVEGELEPIALHQLLAEVLTVVEQTFPAGIGVRSEVPEVGLWTICVDATQLHQVFLNLCLNARDAMPEGGQLTVMAENVVVDEALARVNVEARMGPYVVVRVADTGMGIAADCLDRIFDPFFTTKAVGEGTGLGLSMVLGIVQKHGGFVVVESAPGQGTAFRVFLPAEVGDGVAS